MNSILLAFGALDARLATHCRALSLRRHEVAVRIGVHAHERQAAQRMWFDVDLCVKLDHAPAARDDISQTVDYDFIRDIVAREVGSHHHELQESLCDAIAQAILQRPEVHAVRVATRKPDVYPDSASVGVERVCIKPW
ncbi:dihydroneopterin aldolase [[Acidovorax] ebreus]|uniref:dihydroneopterin aldolase n=1 Tax=Acidovorax ebreus (strain TPSY) TaxID=535289 RepID=A0A9J9Q4R5_ACIET|nr:dihydroneopterin aldolase [[Acidovorax] ebreus]ACM31988.1 dihydroneopterin aldolase [[Acidovorax] ebreus TPSY]